MTEASLYLSFCSYAIFFQSLTSQSKMDDNAASRIAAIRRMRRRRDTPPEEEEENERQDDEDPCAPGVRVPVPFEDENACDDCGPATDYAECRARLRAVFAAQTHQFTLKVPRVIDRSLPCHWDPEEVQLVGVYPPGGVSLELATKCLCPLPSQNAPQPFPPVYCSAWPAWVAAWDEPSNDSAGKDPTTLVKPGATTCFEGAT